MDADLDQYVGRRGLRVFDKDIEIQILIEYARVDQFVFGIEAATAFVCLFSLWIFIKVLHVRVSRRAV